MDNNQHLYEVVFMPIYKPGEIDFKDIRSIYINVMDTTISGAMDKAWKAVTVSDQDYEIVSVSTGMIRQRYYRDD